MFPARVLKLRTVKMFYVQQLLKNPKMWKWQLLSSFFGFVHGRNDITVGMRQQYFNMTHFVPTTNKHLRNMIKTYPQKPFRRRFQTTRFWKVVFCRSMDSTGDGWRSFTLQFRGGTDCFCFRWLERKVLRNCFFVLLCDVPSQAIEMTWNEMKSKCSTHCGLDEITDHSAMVQSQALVVNQHPKNYAIVLNFLWVNPPGTHEIRRVVNQGPL